MPGNADNIEMQTPVQARTARKAVRAAKAKVYSEEWRRKRRTERAPTRLAMAETLVLCLLDVRTLPPSKRPARGEVINDVLRQAYRTFEAMGHEPRGVGETMDDLITSLRERLQTEMHHHPMRHLACAGRSKKHPFDTPVTLTATATYTANRIADLAQDVAGETVG